MMAPKCAPLTHESHRFSAECSPHEAKGGAFPEAQGPPRKVASKLLHVQKFGDLEGRDRQPCSGGMRFFRHTVIVLSPMAGVKPGSLWPIYEGDGLTHIALFQIRRWNRLNVDANDRLEMRSLLHVPAAKEHFPE